jgi:hypothetical protein
LLGGDYHYDQFSVDGKYYIPLSRTLTLAVAGNYQSLTHHDKRLTPMARPYIELRGISRYRYQGDYVSTAQTQLAWEFQPRWILQGSSVSAAPLTRPIHCGSKPKWRGGQGFAT